MKNQDDGILASTWWTGWGRSANAPNEGEDKETKTYLSTILIRLWNAGQDCVIAHIATLCDEKCEIWFVLYRFSSLTTVSFQILIRLWNASITFFLLLQSY